jgi:hypothetical protein
MALTRTNTWWLGIADDLVYKGLTHFLGRTLAILSGNEDWGLMQLSGVRVDSWARRQAAGKVLLSAQAQGVINV